METTTQPTERRCWSPGRCAILASTSLTWIVAAMSFYPSTESYHPKSLPASYAFLSEFMSQVLAALAYWRSFVIFGRVLVALFIASALVAFALQVYVFWIRPA